VDPHFRGHDSGENIRRIKLTHRRPCLLLDVLMAGRLEYLFRGSPHDPTHVMLDSAIPEALTFDDVLLRPAKSSVLPNQVDTRTWFARNLPLNIPVSS
jgi:hypothetical protein